MSRDRRNIDEQTAFPSEFNDMLLRLSVLERRLGSAFDHGLLLGLGDDDHTMYLRTNGVRAMTGLLLLNRGSDEQMRLGGVAGSVSPFLSFYAADGTTRYGYLQGVSSDVRLHADSARNVILGTGGATRLLVNGSDGSVDVYQQFRARSTLTVGTDDTDLDAQLYIGVEAGGILVEGFNDANSVKQNINFQRYGGRMGIGRVADSVVELAINGRLLVDRATPNEQQAVLTVAKYITNVGGSRTWDYSQVRVQSVNGSVATNSAMIALWAAGSSGGYAPIIDCYEGTGEKVRIINSANTSHTAIEASAFNVISTIRTKDLAPPDDYDYLAAVTAIGPRPYRMKIAPQTVQPNDRFKALDARWQQTGKSPLTLKPEHTVVVDHDCSIHGCTGTVDNPCAITANNGLRRGLIAEEVYSVARHAVSLDADLLPEALMVDQVQSLLWGATSQLTTEVRTVIGALLTTVQQLTDRVAALEAATAG